MFFSSQLVDPPPPPLEKSQKNCNTGLDPLKNHKTTKPAFNVGLSSASQRNAHWGGSVQVFLWKPTSGFPEGFWKPQVPLQWIQKFIWKIWKTLSTNYMWTRERSGSVVECLTRDRGAVGSNLTGITALCPWARHINPSLVCTGSTQEDPVPL